MNTDLGRQMKNAGESKIRLIFATRTAMPKKHMAYRKKHKPYILKYKALILK